MPNLQAHSFKLTERCSPSCHHVLAGGDDEVHLNARRGRFRDDARGAQGGSGSAHVKLRRRAAAVIREVGRPAVISQRGHMDPKHSNSTLEDTMTTLIAGNLLASNRHF